MKYNVIIIGAGVAGMSAALYLKRANISCCILEKEMPGGQINYTSTIENYPGFDNISGPDLAVNIYKKIKKEKINIEFQEVIEIENKNDEVIVKTKAKEYKCNYLIIATGKRNRHLNVEHEEELISKGISYCAICDGALYKNKDVVVVGGGESALEESLYLANLCSHITIIHRNENLKATDELIKKVKSKKNISILYNRTIKELISKNNILDKVVLDNNEQIKAEGCFIFIGSNPISEIFKDKLDMDPNGYIKTNDKMQTSVNNIYAIGDIRQKELYQIISAINDSLIATNEIIHKL